MASLRVSSEQDTIERNEDTLKFDRYLPFREANQEGSVVTDCATTWPWAPGVKRTLEEAEDGIWKRREAKAEVVSQVCFSEKEAKAICTDANKAFAERLLNGRFKHLTRG